MNLLGNAGTVVLWCMAVIIGVAVVAVAALWCWDKYSGWKWDRKLRRSGL